MKKKLFIPIALLMLSIEVSAGLFTYTGLGYSTINAKKNDIFNSVALANELSTQGLNFNLGLGYKYDNDIIFKAGYQRVMFSDIHLDNLYVGTGLELDELAGFTPYLGLLLGYSQLTWDKDPVSNVIKVDTRSNSNMLGLELGATYPMTESFSLEIMYQLTNVDHKARVVKSGAMSDIEHTLVNNIYFGLRYSFGDTTQSLPVVVQADTKNKQVIYETIAFKQAAVVSKKELEPQMVDEVEEEIKVQTTPKEIIISSSFNKNSNKLTKELQEKALEIYEFLKLHKDLNAKITGHTSKTKVSGMQYNIHLSVVRANSFKNELIRLGINKTRLISAGKGFLEPLVDNNTEANRAINRRIEIEYSLSYN